MFSYMRSMDRVREVRESTFAPYRSLVMNDLHRNFPDLLYDTEEHDCPCINHMRSATTNDFYREHANYWMNQGMRSSGSGGSINTSRPDLINISGGGFLSGIMNEYLSGSSRVLGGDRARSPVVMPSINVEPRVNIEILGSNLSGNQDMDGEVVDILISGIFGGTGSNSVMSGPFASSFRNAYSQGMGIFDDNMDELSGGLMRNIFRNLMGGIIGGGMESVVVPLNLSSLRANTVVEYGVEGNCSICQDDINSVELVRRIRKCNHKFHIDCVDKWFETSVKCPECRWDVRDPVEVREVRQEDVD
jgi:hypothetical protein